MAAFVRKTIVTITVTFTAADGTATQPTSANCVFHFNDQTGTPQEATIALTHNTTPNTWTGLWDTSVVTGPGPSTVSWMAYGYGALQAAAEGCFEVYANEANHV